MEEGNKTKDTFDINQGHGDHIECLSDSGDAKEFVATWLHESISKGDLVLATSAPVSCKLGDGITKQIPMFYIGAKSPLHLMVLLASDEEEKRNSVVSVYPECDGAEVAVRLTAIHEWAAGVEATLEGEVLGEAARQIAFFDTRYAMNKGVYELGRTYKFRLSAFAYSADVLPPEEREFRFEGQKAVDYRQRIGQEQEYDKEGKPKPVIFRLDEMVAYFSKSNAYPDDAEFQSPMFGKRSIPAFGTSFWKMDIAIARDDEDVVIPLIAKKSLFSNPPKTHDPVRGMLWLQGYCPHAVPIEDESNERE